MINSPELVRYIRYARSRWRFLAASCAVALSLAALISFLLPRQFTATARIVIEPPAGADPRSALAVSPIYLESLKTYEAFADSDTLFQKAVDWFQLRSLLGSRPIESLKTKVLRVELVRSTRILEISATLPDPVRAQKLAGFIAAQAVDLNRSLTNEGGQDLIHSFEQQVTEARVHLEQTDAAWSHLLAEAPVDDLRAQIEQAGQLRLELEKEITNANVLLADDADRERGASPSEAELIRKEESNTRARVAEVQKQLGLLARQTTEKEKMLAERMARREKLDAQRQADRAALATAESHLRDARNEANYRGERLSIIDPGVVPERPSSPNIPLNLAAALLLGLLLPLIWLALEMNLREERTLQNLSRWKSL